MPVLDQTLPAREAAGQCELPQKLIGELFDQPSVLDYNAQPDSEWFSLVRLRPASDESETEGTVLQSDEVSLERVSLALAKGPVVIAATDEQARRIMEHHRRDAFPPE
jgi:hypothetical protein